MKRIVPYSVFILLAWLICFASCKKEKPASAGVTPQTNNQAPIAIAGKDQAILLPTNSVTLNGNGSTDPDNNIATYEWTKISGPSSLNIVNASSIQTSVTNLVQGIYQFELKVTDAGSLFSKDTVQVQVSKLGKRINGKVLEEGTDQPIASATIFVCTSPVDYFLCKGDYLSLQTDANGSFSFNADLFRYSYVEKSGYYSYIFDPCFVSYYRNDSLMNYNDDFTADSIIVKIVPKTNFTIHVKDSSGRGSGTGISLVADVNFHGCCASDGIIGVSLRPGIDTTFTVFNYYGNATYLFRVGNNFDSDCSCFETGFYNQTKYVAKGNNTVLNITY